jgi:hypothetical protein
MFTLLADRSILVCVIAILSTSTAVGQKPPTASQQLQLLIDEHRQENVKLQDAVRTAGSPEARKEAETSLLVNTRDYVTKILPIAKNVPKTATGLEAIFWVLKNAEPGPSTDSALELLAQYHSSSPRLGEILPSLDFKSKGAEKFLRAVADKSNSPVARASAGVTLAIHLRAKGEASEKKEDATKLFKEAETRAIDVISRYSIIDGGSFAKRAEGLIYEMRVLGIGKPALPIEGKDAEGQLFRLSDYRGNVIVLLRFNTWDKNWGTMLEDVKKQGQEFKDRPVKFLGIAEQGAEYAKKEGITLRNWTTDPKTVEAWKNPTEVNYSALFVLDHKNIIRARNISGDKLHKTIENLLTERDQDNGTKPK